MWKEKYKDCLEYIDKYWDKVIHKPSAMTIQGKINNYLPRLRPQTEKNLNIVDMPHAYIVPNDKKFNYVFYWDTYFIFKGIMGTRHEWVMEEMIKNFIYLFQRYGIIPNFNARVSLGRSQPPFFTSMILDTYSAKNNMLGKGIREKLFSRYIHPADKHWLLKAIKVAEQEYNQVWIDENNLYNHHVPGFSLARYGDRDVGYAHSSELESGWDFTSRFYNRCNFYLPIDLNSYLYKYETDFAFVAKNTGDLDKEQYWKNKAEDRKLNMNNLMWDEHKGFYFDYNWFDKKRSEFLSLAGFVPMWAGIASYEQSKKMVNKLDKFETKYGLVITAEESLAGKIDLSNIQPKYHAAIKEIIEPKQWDYPHIWSPLEYLTIIGLMRYGFINDAKRIMENSVNTHAALFRKYKTFFEKINSINGEPGLNFHYENQTGFGWTNAVFYRYIQILDYIDSNKPINLNPDNNQPPYNLAFQY